MKTKWNNVQVNSNAKLENVFNNKKLRFNILKLIKLICDF